ncbi:MAG: D-alanyl-D-alanine carboxypeptidase/D-alanyl-D-alanine-endopeptidase [Proteobacteria bacterium]|nr:MAG: D-alanyl-D-alanine carboxypeptidase/D-alanyl-D-alanine-endopeptidase [Pseudomonadota bacterium]
MRRLSTSFMLLAVSMSIATIPAHAQSRLMPPDGGSESILIVRMSDGKTIYESSPKKALIPASVTKVLTSAAMLHYLKPATTLKTKFFINGPRTAESIQGPLYVKGDGDPMLVNEKLWQMAADLKNMGITKFEGDLIIDNSLFDDEERDSSRMDRAKESDRAYDAPVTAFGINFNTLPIVISPGLKAGDPAKVNFDPYPLPGIGLRNKTSTTSGSENHIGAVRSTSNGDSSIVVNGTIGTQNPTTKVYRSMGDPLMETGEQLRAFLLNEGITIKGRVKGGKVPASAKLLYTIDSYDIAYIVQGLNHFSNNYIADALVKRLGAKLAGDGTNSGSLDAGVDGIEKFLKNEVGIKDKFEIHNGSGLDHRNNFSADQIVKVLLYMQKRMDLFPEYLASFPASGWTGTLKKRFKGEDLLDGMVRAKTGTLTQPVAVSSIAGYMGHPKHGMLAFAILNNSKTTTVAEFRKRQDNALRKIWEEL